MLSQDDCRIFTEILKNELIEATGCTEPIALALAGANVAKQLEGLPTKVDVFTSGNMIKNVKSVTVPNSGGLKGIDVAVLLGIISGNSDDALQVVSDIDDRQREILRQELEKKYVKVYLQQDVPSLYILVKAENEKHSCEVELQKSHTNISRIVKDGVEIFNNHTDSSENYVGPDKSKLSIEKIIEYAETVDIEEVREVIERQIIDNVAISNEGLTNTYGAQVGKTLMETGNDIYTRARAKTAAGSDARMNGCPMPVVINSGSGNQGMTTSLPVIEFANELGCSREQLIRALCISNLISVHQKKYIGALSAYCGAVSAAAGAAAAICWLKGDGLDVICDTVSNSIVSIGGMVCDGAKSSCAIKISLALESAFTAMKLAENDRNFNNGEGLVKQNAEETIKAVGRMAKDGMQSTDIEILNIMLDD